jgi:hypothetical protein
LDEGRCEVIDSLKVSSFIILSTKRAFNPLFPRISGIPKHDGLLIGSDNIFQVTPEEQYSVFIVNKTIKELYLKYVSSSSSCQTT